MALEEGFHARGVAKVCGFVDDLILDLLQDQAGRPVALAVEADHLVPPLEQDLGQPGPCEPPCPRHKRLHAGSVN
jgi:hypothetical protein